MGQDEARIRRGLSRRARSMMGRGAPAEIDLAAAPVVGPEDAPVTLVVYACARCPYCSKLVPEIYQALAEPPLADDVRMAFRVFPIRGHEGSTPAGLGFAAAAEMGAFWPFLLQAYGNFDEFSEEVQPEWAEAAGLEREAFLELMADPATRESLVASKKEGLVNGVEETPTLFINGRRWVGDLETAEVLDALAEEAERVKASSRSDG
jgi:protein-disulfide isomerase